MNAVIWNPCIRGPALTEGFSDRARRVLNLEHKYINTIAAQTI